MLRKTLTLGVLVVLLVVVAAPVLVGWYLARYQQRLVDQLAVPGLVTVRDSRFTRGWFNSHWQIRLTPDKALCSGPRCPVVTINSTVHHGPLPLTAPASPGGGLTLAQAVIVSTVNLAPVFAGTRFSPPLAQLQAVTRIALDGAVDTRIALPGTRTQASHEALKARVTSDPAKGQITLPAGRDALQATLAWPKFKVVGEHGGQLGLQGLQAAAGGDTRMPGFWRSYRLQLQALRAADTQGRGGALHGLVLNADLQAGDNDAPASDFDLRISRLVARGEEYGPLIVAGRLQGKAPDALAAQPPALRNLYGHGMPPGLTTLAGGLLLRDRLPALLAAAPALRIKRLLLSTPHGDVSGQLSLAVPAQQPPPADLVAVLQRLDGHIKLQAPAKLLAAIVGWQLRASAVPSAPPPTAQAIDAQLARMVKEKLLVSRPEENAYAIQARLAGGKLTLNGRERPRWQRLLASVRGGMPAP